MASTSFALRGVPIAHLRYDSGPKRKMGSPYGRGSCAVPEWTPRRVKEPPNCRVPLWTVASALRLVIAIPPGPDSKGVDLRSLS